MATAIVGTIIAKEYPLFANPSLVLQNNEQVMSSVTANILDENPMISETDITTLPWVNNGQWCKQDFGNDDASLIFGTDVADSNLSYVNVSAYSQINLYGPANQRVRLFINRSELGDLGIFYVDINEEGVGIFDCNKVLEVQPTAKYIHLNGVKASAWNTTLNISSITVSGNSVLDYDEIAEAIVTRSDVDVKFINDELYPWYISGDHVINGNRGNGETISNLSFTFNSDKKTEITFDWLRNYYSWHTVLLYVDGVLKEDASSSSYQRVRLFLDEGQHVVLFRDTIPGYSNYDYDYSYIKNIQVKEILPIEDVVLTENSQKITFENDEKWFWTSEEGYIQNTNYGHAYTSSTFSTTFTIDQPSKFSFEYQVTPYDFWWDSATQSYKSYQNLYTIINGETYMTGMDVSGWSKCNVLLPEGTHTIEWLDTIANTTTPLYSRIRNIELSSNWVDVDIASNAGTLGVEVLYLVNVLNDVELLKVTGTLNSTDWATIKQMKNLIALDLTDAKFDAVPNYAFDGLSSVSSVKLPKGVKTIGQYAFRGTQLLNIDIPSTVTSIGQYAFADLRLKAVNFDDNSQLTYIGYDAFARCTNLQEFIMPNTVTTLGSYNNDYSSDYDAGIFYRCYNLKKIHFSDALSSIEQYMCTDCRSLEEVHLPANVKVIRDCAFQGCNKLRHIDLPSTLERIDNNAFNNCGLDSIKLPLKLSVLESYAFQNCDNLKYIELPSYIGGYNRNFYDCNSIEKVVCQSATPPVITNDPFQNCNSKSSITLVVPSFAVVNYKLDSYWYQFGSIQEGDDIDNWIISSELSLTNNRRMNGKPDIELYQGGSLRVGGAAPMEVKNMILWVSEGNPCRLLNDSPNMSADSLTSMFYVDANKWYFFTPLHDVNLANVTHSANASYVFRYYDAENRANNGTGSSWRNVDNGKLLAGQGYIFHCNSSGWINLPAEASVHSQVFTTSDVTKTLSVHESTASANKNWNYVGNPYPSYYDIYYMDFTAPITVWTGSTYKAYSIADDNYVLRPMQSFFVQKPDAVDAIVFHKEGRQISSEVNRPSYAKVRTASQQNDNRKFFNLQITDDESIDEMRIVVNKEASLNYELECDASKFMSMDNTVPQLFSLDSNGNNYAINERPFSDGTVALGYFAGNAGFYTISAMRADGTAVLYDKVLNKTVNLNDQDYTFYSDATESANTSRFVLTLTVDNSTTSITTNTSDKNVSVYAVDGMIVIKADNENASIYSIDGKLIRSLNVKGAANVNVNNGSYIIKINDKTIKTVVY